MLRKRRKLIENTFDTSEWDLTALDILNCAPVNPTDKNHVEELAKDIAENGWNGPPVLAHVAAEQLITGSHRHDALKYLWDEELWDYTDMNALGYIGISVDDIVDEYCKENDCILDWEFPFDWLHKVFAGTWVEPYVKDSSEW